MIILALGSIFSGFVFKDFLIGSKYNNFWNDSILILQTFDLSKLPVWLITITPFLVIISIPISFYFYVKNTKLLEKISY